LGVGNFCSAFDQVVKPVSLFDLNGLKHLQHPRHSFRRHTCLVGGLHIGPDLAIIAVAYYPMSAFGGKAEIHCTLQTLVCRRTARRIVRQTRLFCHTIVKKLPAFST